MVEHYLICALWSEKDDDATPLGDNYGLADIAEEAWKQAEIDCKRFLATATIASLDAEQVGHDFWLTRNGNGNGTGFWDRNLGVLGDQLTAVAAGFNETNLYVGDDGLLYLS
jgi:hypothetical protein